MSHKNIVVTGASSGIGKSIMEELLAKNDGSRILAACRHAEKIGDYGERVVPFSCDLSTKEGVDALFAKAEEVFDGQIDLYFCNAGAPYYELRGNWTALAKERKADRFFLSVTHEGGTAAAFKASASTWL